MPDLLKIDARDEEIDDILKRLTAVENVVFAKKASSPKTTKVTKRVLKGYKTEIVGCENGSCQQIKVPQYEYVEEEVPISETVIESSGTPTYTMEFELNSSQATCPDCGRTDCPSFNSFGSGNGYGADGRIRNKDAYGREVPNIMGVSPARTVNGSPRFQFNENNTVYRIAPIRTIWRKMLTPFF